MTFTPPQKLFTFVKYLKQKNILNILNILIMHLLDDLRHRLIYLNDIIVNYENSCDPVQYPSPVTSLINYLKQIPPSPNDILNQKTLLLNILEEEYENEQIIERFTALMKPVSSGNTSCVSESTMDFLVNDIIINTNTFIRTINLNDDTIE